MALFALSAGLTVHPSDIWMPFRWLRYASPCQWAYQLLTFQEFLGNSWLHQDGVGADGLSSALSFKCVRRTVFKYSQGLQLETATQCKNVTGAQVFEFARLALDQIPVTDVDRLYYVGVPVIAAWGLLAFLLNFCCIFCNHKPKVRRRYVS